MDFDLTDEQRMLKESARKLMKRVVVPYLEAFPEGQLLSFEDLQRLLKKLIPLGYLGSTVAEEYGGSGLDPLTYGLLMEGSMGTGTLSSNVKIIEIPDLKLIQITRYKFLIEMLAQKLSRNWSSIHCR